jgi:TPR repeat protein/flagellar basal body-associated protein FliL
MRFILFALLASCLSLGLQAESDHENYLKLAKGGNEKAQYLVGISYQLGYGGPKKDLRVANYWFSQSANRGYALAQNELGSMYANGNGVPQDYKEAVEWWTKSAEQGNAMGQFNLGVMYATGKGVPEDDKEAVKWYRKSAEQGNADAQFNLGYTYDNGEGVPEDDKEAVKWYRKSAEQGAVKAQYLLGIMYGAGWGVAEDYVASYAWIIVAKANGQKDVEPSLQFLKQRMSKEQIAEAQKLAKEIFKRTEANKQDYKDGKRVEVQEQARKTEEEGSLLALYTLLQMNKPVQAQGSQLTEGGQLRDMELSGEEKYYELTGLITNLGGPIKSRYIDIELKLEGLAGDFEKQLEINEHRLRNKALTIMGQYTYEDAQLDGFQERVRVDLKKGFSIVLKKYRNGESDLIRNIYFTQFVVQ